MSVRLTYQPDETLHSFIFRVCLVNGIEQHADVTTRSKKWRIIPRINAETAKHFKYYNDHDFLLLIRNSWGACKSARMFTDPTEYMSDVENIYTPTQRREQYNTLPQIKYCIDCMREAIKKKGYGYFKSSWHYYYSTYCITHNKGLTTLLHTPYERNHDSLRTILRGEHPVGCYSVIDFNNTRAENTPSIYLSTNEYNTLPYDNGDLIYIADCLRNEIIKFILSFPGELPKMSLINDFAKKNTIKNYSKSYLSKDQSVSKMLRIFFQENFIPFMSFWEKNAVKTPIPCGVININDIVEYIYIFRNIDSCNMCNLLTCPVKKRSRFSMAT
ncbi:TniQ family protein [Enterobacter hormaechei]|uniref:TniQ family protein n=1 Tax=Enterobacter hormaechei TaxID=158836 RepID=UPI002DBC3A9F|nr:TniQ family protein [Enterobacter hormaechei]MEB7375015.1 hypothetical protein [Enterobacter hormaechei]